jgi:uncharacterized protein with von Willebrand factor type A (vWA) domain
MSGVKAYIAGGCVMRGLKGVYNEDAELYVRFFDTSLKTEMVARTRDEAKQVMHHVLHGSFSGGGTEITECTKGAVAKISQNQN